MEQIESREKQKEFCVMGTWLAPAICAEKPKLLPPF